MRFWQSLVVLVVKVDQAAAKVASDFCRVVRFDAPPTYIVLDESKVARGLVKKRITDRLTHSIEKLPAEEVPVFAEPPAKTTILSHVKANASQTLPEVDALRGL